MIEAVRMKSLVEIGDRVQVDIEGVVYSAFIKEVADDGLVLEWREIEILKEGGRHQEAMITKECFVDRELIKTITKIR